MWGWETDFFVATNKIEKFPFLMEKKISTNFILSLKFFVLFKKHLGKMVLLFDGCLDLVARMWSKRGNFPYLKDLITFVVE